MKLAVVGAGWAGLAAAVAATQRGHQVTVYEASRQLGGRARTLPVTLPDGQLVDLDNGQHILIGAYTETLRLMRLVGVAPEAHLLRTPLDLRLVNGSGVQLPHLPTPLDAVVGIARAKGWSWRDKWSLLKTATRWQMQGFQCAPTASVRDLCSTLTPQVVHSLIEPLCVSALNTPAASASGQVFLTVLRDSLFSTQGGSNLLLPRSSLGALFPDAAAQWLLQHGAQLHLGQRVSDLRHAGQWHVNGEPYDRVIWATHSSAAAQATASCEVDLPADQTAALRQWSLKASNLQFESITTVYAWGVDAALERPMVALPSNNVLAHPSEWAPAQFAFDRARLGGPAGLLALVVSASHGDAAALEQQVINQAQRQLGLQLTAVKTVVEKRATFACTPGLLRPPQQIAPGLLACGDYVAGPYPATLEGAIRSGWAAGLAQ